MPYSFEKFVRETYEEGSIDKRKIINAEYDAINSVADNFHEKNIPAKEAADQLGNMSLFRTENASSQLYAFDTMLRSLANIDKDDKSSVDAIVEEALFDIAVTRHPIKRMYLLGILKHFGSEGRLNEIQQRLEAGEQIQYSKEEISTISNIIASAHRLKSHPYPLMQEVANNILNDFPTDINKTPSNKPEKERKRIIAECEGAGLIAKYYEKEWRATRKPDIAEALLSNDNIGVRLDGNDIPRNIMCLPESRHPSQEKIDKMDNNWHIPLIEISPQLARIESNSQGEKTKRYVKYDIDPQQVDLFIRVIRSYKDANQLSRLQQFEEALKNRIWQSLDNDAKAQLGEIDDLSLIFRTVREYPEGHISSVWAQILQEELEKELDKVFKHGGQEKNIEKSDEDLVSA